MSDRPRWLRSELVYAVIGSAVILSIGAIFGVIDPWVVPGGIATLVVANRLTARLNTGRWDGIPSDEGGDPGGS
jgi:hypothetical protein